MVNGIEHDLSHVTAANPTEYKKPIHEKIRSITAELGELLERKNKAYGNSALSSQKILKVLYPNGVRVDQYQDMMLIVRILDKLSRIAKGEKSAFDESPYRDIAGYAILGAAQEEN